MIARRFRAALAVASARLAAVAALSIAALAPAGQVHAQAAQWSYTQPPGANSLATYPGDVAILGTCTGCGGRPLLTSAMTFYVATTGSDSNTCLTAGSPCLTVQGAVNKVRAYDLNSQTVTIQLAAGTYGGSAVITGLFVGQAGATSVTLKGDTTTPANVIFNNASGCTINVVQGGALAVQGIQFQGNAFSHLCANSYGNVSQSLNNFGATTGFHMYAVTGGIINSVGAYSIVGGASQHLHAESDGQFFANAQTVTLTGTPAFSSAFVGTTTGGVVQQTGMTYTGSATGTRYTAVLNSVINTNGGGANYFPGSVAGSIATGAQYN